MENLLECAICMEKYNTTNKIPRILTCGHTFCSSCLEIICERSGIESSGISCPLDKTKGHQNKNVSEIWSQISLSSIFRMIICVGIRKA